MTVARKKSPYENPSFTDESVEEMTKFLLVSILYGIFSYTNRGLRVNFDVIRGPRPFRRVRFNKKQINDSEQTSNDNIQKYDKDISGVYTMEQNRHSVIQKHEGRNCEACDKNKGCGKRRKRRKKKKAKKEEEEN